MLGDTILEIKNISKAYPGVQALDDVSIRFREGEVHAIVGENGAGKSTLIKMISGADTPDIGEILYEGRSYEKLTPHKAKSLGIETIYQEFNLIPALSVAENLYLGDNSPISIMNRKKQEKKAKDFLDSIGIDIAPDAIVGNLSVAYQQLVEIAKAVVKDVKLLIMDEPTAPLSTNEVEMLFSIIADLKKRGVTIVYISHRLLELSKICDRVSVMRDGNMIEELPIAEADRETLIRLMVGRQLGESFPARDTKVKDVMFEARHVSGKGVNDVSLSVRNGEILGLAGLIGAGRTEFTQLVFGLEPMTQGELLIEGMPIAIKRPRTAIANGLCLVPEDRKKHGSFLSLSIRWNITISILERLSKYLFIMKKKDIKTAEAQRSALNIKTHSLDQLAQNLSGGNQQKVVIAKCLASKVKVLIMDEPTRGIDVGAKQEIYKLMNELTAQGVAIIMISSEMEELLGMSDRLIVLCRGQIMGELMRKDFTQEKVMDLAAGE